MKIKSFIINLSKIPSSADSALKVKESLESFDMEAELFEGTYGTVAKDTYAQNGRTPHLWGLKGPARPLPEQHRIEMGTPGIIGCFDSHYRLWQKCVEIGEPILIFEDDVILVRPFIPVEWVDVLSVAFSHYKKMMKYINYLENPTGDPQAMMYSQASMPGNGGYAIHPHAAKKLVETYANSFLPADNAINQYVVRLQIHNHMMGRARFKTEGNVSLIRTNYWEKK